MWRIRKVLKIGSRNPKLFQSRTTIRYLNCKVCGFDANVLCVEGTMMGRTEN